MSAQATIKIKINGDIDNATLANALDLWLSSVMSTDLQNAIDAEAAEMGSDGLNLADPDVDYTIEIEQAGPTPETPTLQCAECGEPKGGRHKPTCSYHGMSKAAPPMEPTRKR
jgi:hypothetical protein